MMEPKQDQPRWKRISLIAAQVLLVLITIALIAAILLPVKVGTSPELQRRGMRFAP